MNDLLKLLGFFGPSIGGGEIILIMVVALLLFGADRLPAIARALGRALNEFKRTASEIRDELLNEKSSASTQTYSNNGVSKYGIKEDSNEEKPDNNPYSG